jgi:DNA-binding CsgD family transcriptional regulator
VEAADRFGMNDEVPSSRQPTRPSHLSRRELEVLGHIQRGLTNREIAQRLFVSTNTVNKHVHQVLRKLEVTNRVQAAIYERSAATWHKDGEAIVETVAEQGVDVCHPPLPFPIHAKILFTSDGVVLAFMARLESVQPCELL